MEKILGTVKLLSLHDLINVYINNKEFSILDYTSCQY